MDYRFEGDFMQNPIWTNYLGERALQESDYTEVLSKVPIFSTLDKTDLALVEHIMHIRRYEKGEYIFHAGNPGVGMFIVDKGNVSVRTVDTQGHEIEIASLGEGTFFGEIALLDDTPRTASIVALNTCNMLIFFRPDLFDLMEKKPKLGISILTELGKLLITRIDSVRKKMLDKKSKGAE